MNHDSAPPFIDEALLLDPDAESRLERSWKRRRHYGFSIGGYNLLLPEGLYSEMVATPSVAPLPNSPPYCCGLMNVRGDLVPVYGLEAWLGQEVEHESPQLVLIVGKPHLGAALVVKDKPQALDVASMVEIGRGEGDALAPRLRPLIQKTYLHNSAHWHVVDHEALFTRLSQGDADTTVPSA